MHKNSAAAAGLLLLAPVVFAACSRAQARTTPDLPPLEVPAPPPRLVEAPLVVVPPPIGLVDEQPRTGPLIPAAARGATRPEPRPEVPAADAPGPEAPRLPEEGTRPAVLQTVPAGQEGSVRIKIRAQLASATSNLNRVDYSALGTAGRENYDQAKRFISQAEEAIKGDNLVFAATVADKAATLAGQLAAR